MQLVSRKHFFSYQNFCSHSIPVSRKSPYLEPPGLVGKAPPPPHPTTLSLNLPFFSLGSLALTTSFEVYESTADVVQLAWKVAANPSDTKSNNQLRVKCDKWSEQLDIVRATVDKLVNPWSVSASCVVLAVTLKDQKLYTKQVKYERYSKARFPLGDFLRVNKQEPNVIGR